MKTIGLIGGMSWESTSLYYEIINNTIKEELGGLHSAKILMYSVDFAEIEKYQENGDWEKSGEVLGEIAWKLEVAGADFIVICTNTMHKVTDIIEKHISIPILHIARATAEKLKEDHVKNIFLLGTKYTMVQDFYKKKIEEEGIKVIVPKEDDIEIVNNIIYDELCLGEILEKSKKEYLRIINSFPNIDGVILGCTEIGLLIRQKDLNIPVYDTTLIHGTQAALNSLE